jgi:oxygen-dependent protoporphyrinogen oxidase
MARRIAIVGGGISGLALAERLAAGGAEPIVLEADHRTGGKVRSVVRDGYIMEAGPNGFLDKVPATRSLAGRIGILDAFRPATGVYGNRYLVVDGKLETVPGTPGAFLKSGMLPWWSKARIALEPFSGRVKPGVDESIADFGRRHLGDRATAVMLGGMVLGIFAGDVEQLSLKSCFPRMAEMEKEYRSLFVALVKLARKRKKERLSAPPSTGLGAPTGILTSVEGGLEAYVQRLAEHLGPVVHTRVRAERIVRGEVGWTLVLDDRGTQRELTVDEVVLACPADAAADLLAPHDSGAADLARGIPYPPIAVVHLSWPKERITAPKEGFGFLVPPRENRPILGAVLVHSIFPWRAPEGQTLYTVMIGGATRPDLARLPEDDLRKLAAAEVAPMVGARGEPTLAEVVKWERAIPQYVVGHAARVEEIETRVKAFPGLYLAGNAWHGVAFNDCIEQGEKLAARILG